MQSAPHTPITPPHPAVALPEAQGLYEAELTDDEGEEIPPQLWFRLKVMGMVALVLLGFVAYLYHAKISAPLERMPPVGSAEVVIRAVDSESMLVLPDEVSPASQNTPNQSGQ